MNSPHFVETGGGSAVTLLRLEGDMPNSVSMARIWSSALFAMARYGDWIGKPAAVVRDPDGTWLS